ncbi:MAG: UDP-N-acetylglucosamine diphosphorylase / glucose-phosphate thymidylyltransferase [Patescibacteria group bacterium]|nr:UDP-N-acetylglucosamine diphosphorylase / glucose-phosphate thymidylyltransferase [Patescibacteria group bacterium]
MNQPKTAVILCAGRGTRMGALTENCPKPLLPLSNGQTLLEIKLHALPKSITKVILIVGYLGDMIREHIGNMYEGKEITYVVQDIEKAYGTGAALTLAQEYIDKETSFLVLMGDDIYAKEDLEELCTYENAILLSHEGEKKFGAFWQVRIENGNLAEFYEKVPREELCTGIINAGAYVISPKKYFSVQPLVGADGEIQIPPTISLLIQNGVTWKAVRATYWKQVTAPEDLMI